MEATREIYWNVGQGVLIPMYLIAFICIAVLVYGFIARAKVYKLGRSENRFDNLARRVTDSLINTIFQLKVFRGFTLPGVAHAFFFWSFLALLAGTTLIFIQADITAPLFDYKFLKGGFYKLFSLVLDVAGLIAMIAILGLFVRRYLFRPEGLESSSDDVIMHALLFLILATGFIVEGLRMAATELQNNMALAWFSPVGLAIGQLFAGMTDASLRSWHVWTWWIHFAFSMAFIVSIPFTKFRHLFTGPANYFFADLRAKGSIETIDLEDESAESFGAATIADFTWKDLFDADACTLCKRCQDQCPASATGKPLSPMKLVTQIGEGAMAPESALVELVTEDAIWACVTCRACQEICPVSVEHVNKIIEMRRNLALMEGRFPGDEVTAAMNNIEVNGNPLGLAPAARGDWAEGLDLNPGGADILYFTGCYASYDKRNIKVAESFVKICAAAGVKVKILGKGEKCCGEPARKMGNEYLYQTVAMENIEAINESGADTVVCTCPHCFNTLNRDYRDLGLETKVEHYTVFLDRLLGEGKLKLKSEPFESVYHDSCYIGRYNDIFDEPRRLLAQAGGTVREMEKNRYQSFCCGAGGGRILADEKLGERINKARVEMAESAGGGDLVSNCPFCLTMFEDGVKTAGLDEKIITKDIAEIIAERLY